jgi:bacillithiol biosynthesis deacetylase BshB1
VSEFGVDVLAFGPHPDDVELFCGGTLLRMRELGHSTAVVDMSRGELASAGTPELRAKEAEAAAALMQLSFRDNLGLPDGGIDASSREQLDRVVSVLRARRPELVLVPYSQERHPDHVATSELITKALFFAGLRKHHIGEAHGSSERHVPRQVLYYAMRHRMPPSFVIDTSSVWDRKLAAIACHASQVNRPAGGDATLISSPDTLHALAARDAYYGSLIGVRYGEPLRSASMLGMRDPLAYFRDHAFGPAHAFEGEP